jgi:copper chaperone CopZ
MRQVFTFMVIGTTLAFSNSARADTNVEVKGPHICCKQCVSIVAKILGKVDGVSEIKSDIVTKTITFTAKDDTAANAGVKALITGGFSGSATAGSKELKVDLPEAKKGEKVSKVSVKDVHVCCGQCQTAINKVFKAMDAKVSFEGQGPQKTVIVEKPDSLEASAVLETLRKAGFNGTIEK